METQQMAKWQISPYTIYILLNRKLSLHSYQNCVYFNIWLDYIKLHYMSHICMKYLKLYCCATVYCTNYIRLFNDITQKKRRDRKYVNM